MSIYVLVLLINGHWMTVSDQNGEPKAFPGPFLCEAAYTAATALAGDMAKLVEEHRCVGKTL